MTTMNYNVCIIGSAGVGKTSIIKRITTGEWSAEYISTKNLEEVIIEYHTTSGIMRFTVTEHNGDGEHNYVKADAFIGILDKSCKISAEWLENEITFVKEKNKKSAIIVVGANKVDIKASNDYWAKKFPHAIECCAKRNYCLDDLFLSVCKKLTGNNELEFIDPPAIVPPEVLI